MTGTRAIVGLVGVALGLVAAPSVRAADADASTGAPPRIARFTIGALAGTGYGWPNGLADVNHDIPASGGNWARLGHVIVEGGVLFPRAHIFVVTGPRFQADHRDDGRVRVRPRVPREVACVRLVLEGRVVAALTGRVAAAVCGAVDGLWRHCPRRHAARRRLRAHPRNQTCVDTVTAGPLFIGWGAGLRARLTANLDAVLGLENQLGLQADVLLDLFNGRGLEEHTFNFDFNLGVAAAF